MLIAILIGTALTVADTPAPQFTMADCDDPAARRKLLATDPEKLPALEALRSVTTQNEARMDKLISRLAERAGLTPEQRSEMAIGMFESPQVKPLFEEGMGLANQMLADVDAIVGSKDELQTCRTIVHLTSLVPAVDANANRQWDALRGLVEAEAKRQGVSLAD